MRSRRQGSWSRYLKSTAIAASLVLAGCGLKPGESSGDGGQTENDDLSLTKSGLSDDGGILKKPITSPADTCVVADPSSMNVQSVPPVETRFGPLDVYLGSSSWSPQRIDSLQKAGQSALFGAGLRILGSNGAQSPLSAPWLGIDHITITPALNHQSSPLGNMFGMRLFFDSRRLKANLQKINSDGSVEFEIPLRLDSRSFFIKTPRGTIPALRAKLEKPLSAGSYRLSIFGDKNTSTINLDVRPGDLNNSFSVDAVDQDFIARNRELTVSSVSNQNHLLGLLKADLNSDDRVDQSDLDEFQKLNPEANRISSDFVGEPLTQNPGDISKILVRGSHWGRGFQGALGTDAGFTLAPANCLRSLPWIGMNQLLIASPGSAPVSGLVTLSDTSNGKENVLLSSSLEKVPRLGGFSVLSLRSPLKSGVYQLKISVNNATKVLDGTLTRVIKFRVLEGDVDGNYVVDRTDLEVLKKYFSQRANNENVRADLNANGIINSADVTIAISRQGLAIKEASTPTSNQQPAVSKKSPDDLQLEASFGQHLAIDGDYAAVTSAVFGSKSDNEAKAGNVYFYRRNNNGSWDQKQKASFPLGEGSGLRVALMGNNAIVSSPWAFSSPNSNSGLVVIYERNDLGVWIEKARFTGEPNELFGVSVAISGDIAVVGAPTNSASAHHAGVVYVFERSNSGEWSKKTVLKPTEAKYGIGFGSSVSLSKDLLAVGAPGDFDGDLDFSTWGYEPYLHGSITIFESLGGTWSNTAKIGPKELPAGKRIGASIAASNNTVVIGVPGGSVLVYNRTQNGTWQKNALLTPDDTSKYSEFGTSVAISGNRIFIGDPVENRPGLDMRGTRTDRIGGVGAAYLFEMSADRKWTKRSKTLGTADGRYGSKVAISGDTALVGDPFEGSNGFVFSGSAYFINSISKLPASPQSAP